MAALADCYALKLDAPAGATVSDFILSRREQPAPGESVSAGPAEFVVVRAEGGRILAAGLRFRATAAQRPVASRRRRVRKADRRGHVPLPLFPDFTWPVHPVPSTHHADHARAAPG
jgi:hypothetical protein